MNSPNIKIQLNVPINADQSLSLRFSSGRFSYLVRQILRCTLMSTVLLGTWGCTNDGSSGRSIDELIAQCSEQEILGEDGMCEPRSTPAHPPQCIDVDGALCLISYHWRDGAPRPHALTPGESALLESMMIFNSGDREIQLTRLSAAVTSPHLTLDDSAWSRNMIEGSEWVEANRVINQADLEALREACAQGVLPAGEGCIFNLDLDFSIDEDAPTNASQRIEVASETQRGARFSWSLPLNIVDAVEGINLDGVSFEESSEDGAIHPGDRVRFTAIELTNSTFAPFRELRALLVASSELFEVDGETERWEIGDERVEGLVSAEVRCPQATSNEDLALNSGRCTLTFSGEISIAHNLEDRDVKFTLYLQDQNINVGAPIPITLNVEPWVPELSLAGFDFVRDDNRDLRPSAGERMIIRQIMLENEGDVALSLRGRVSIESPLATLSPASEVSINETSLRDDFYEHCPPQSSCEVDVNLIIDISEDAQLGEIIPITLELIDQGGAMYLFESQFELVLPDVDLQLAEFEVSQDTLDRALSPGERGVISYIKLVNEGLADALDLSVVVSADSSSILFEDESQLSFTLNTDSNEFDAISSTCPSTSFESEGYCYSQDDITFVIAEDALLGEEVTFLLQVTDLWGTVHELTHSITLF